MFYERPEWHKKAACRGMGLEGKNIFFPQRGEGLDEAQAICKGCPVRKDCEMQSIIYDDDHGVWGGEGNAGRKRLIKQMVRNGSIHRTLVGSRKFNPR